MSLTKELELKSRGFKNLIELQNEFTSILYETDLQYKCCNNDLLYKYLKQNGIYKIKGKTHITKSILYGGCTLCNKVITKFI